VRAIAMTHPRTGLITAALLAIAATIPPTTSSALDQWPKPCRPDISRTCHDVMTENDRTVLTCLQANEKKLRQACRKLLQTYGHVPEAPAPAKRRRR
jgi:hypothetical protein